MRAVVFGGVLTVLISSAPAAEPPLGPPTRITYALGGALSGPYRISVDLVSGGADIAEPMPGVHGDGAGISPWALPATRRAQAPEVDLRELRALAVTIWFDGPQQGVVWEHGQPMICMGSTDAIRHLIIERGEAVRRFDSIGCENAAAARLLLKLSCLSHPEQEICAR